MNPVFFPETAAICDADDLREELATTYRHDVSAHTAALMKALREYAEKEGYYLATVEDLRSVWII